MDAGLFKTIKGFKFSSVSLKTDSDGIDRLNSYYTPLLIVVFAVLVSAKQYVGQPLQCWVPAEFNDVWEAYAESYCWIKNTYFVPPSENIPHYIPDRRDSELSYYQWVPFVLALIALLFYLPKMLWRLTSWQSGINITSLVQAACDVVHADPNERKGKIEKLAFLTEDNLVTANEARFSWAIKLRNVLSYFLCCCGRHHGNYLTNIYLLHKLLYVVNVIGQFYLLNNFLGTGHFYGWTIITDLANGREWPESGNFPRVTMCDFQVRALANVQHHTVQCVLMINLFNEKIFIFLWFWFFIVALATCFNFIIWFWRMVPGFKRNQFIKSYLKKDEAFTKPNQFNRFVSKFIRADGVFLLRLIYHNAGAIVTSELINQMWKNFEDRETPKLLNKDETKPSNSDKFDKENPVYV